MDKGCKGSADQECAFRSDQLFIPSGHATNATVYYGSSAFATWKKHKAVSVLFIILIFLTMFSRNYLGVHTPQDVLVGVGVTALIIVVNDYILKKIEEEPSRDLIVLIVGITLSIAALIYYSVKPYPMDYAGGRLLVDPADMKIDAFGGVGTLIGFVIGWFIEHRYIRFDDGSKGMKMVKRLIISAAASIPLYFLIKRGAKVLAIVMNMRIAKLSANMIVFLYILIFVPFVIKITEKCKSSN
jgi:hypothetical protein